jgi:hypothetical protein
MATAPTSRRLNLTRDQLAQFLTDQQQIRQFELLFSTVDELQVIVGTDFEYQADTAAATANEALAQISALAQDTAVDDAVLNAKVQQALDAIPGLAQALELLALAPRQELGTIASQNSDNVNITGGLISGLDAPLPVASGGIGVTTAPANQVFSGPTAGAAAAPAFRSLVVADIPALTSGSSILYGNGSGGFSNVTIGTGVSFAAGTLSATGSGGTVTSVTGTSPVVSSGGTTPAISLASGYGDTQNPYAAKTANYVLAAPNGSSGVPTFRALVAADIPALSYVSSIGVTAPITSTGGLTPTIGITQSGTASNGYLSSTDWNTFNNKQPAGTYVTAVSVVSANGLAGTSSGGATPALTLSTTITGLLKGNGTAISAATSGIDYAPATSGTSILYGNGAGGFSNVTVGSGLSFSAGTLAATTGAPSAPVTQTANFTVAATDVWLINNKSGSTCTVTLPTASTNSGRVLYFQNYQVQALVSASSNVVPLAGGAAGTSILLASSGDSATLVSDGSNWLMTQYIPNNILLLE